MSNENSILLEGNCLDRLKDLDDNSIDSVVTDPPYGLSFMGKKWDYDVPSVDLWREVFRVLKPGGHVLSFGGTRTYHRMVVAIEDAGFEIRDQVQWLYGSGFPKSHDISKAIDKAAGESRATEYKPNFKNNDYGKGMGGGEWNAPSEPPKSADAKRWQGWGTALKPANEPICLARKPLEKGLTVAENVLKYGTGALNIDASRIGFANEADAKAGRSERPTTSKGFQAYTEGEHDALDRSDRSHITGRWPANIILDETAAEMLDAQSGESKSQGGGKKAGVKYGSIMGKVSDKDIGSEGYYGDTGGASRFFYVAKASKKERNAGLERMQDGVVTGERNNSAQANHHPTVKPIKLMEYLCRMITPPNGIILDPFMGSGSTGVAAVKLGYIFVGIEMSEEYFEIAEKRIKVS